MRGEKQVNVSYLHAVPDDKITKFPTQHWPSASNIPGGIFEINSLFPGEKICSMLVGFLYRK